jgi:glycerol kinase
MQFQADILDVAVLRPKIAETTALGAAYAAGLGAGYWSGQEELKRNWALDKRIEPTMTDGERSRLYRSWQKAVQRSFDWVTAD